MRPRLAILAPRAGSRVALKGKVLNARRVKVRTGLAKAQIGLEKVRPARVRRIFSDPRERARVLLPAVVLPGTSSMVRPLVVFVRVLVVLRADTAPRRRAPS
jgi:hypothetical protein